MSKNPQNPKGAGRKPIGDKAMSPSERKKLEREQKRDFGLVSKSVWLLPEDVPKVEKLSKKALNKYNNS